MQGNAVLILRWTRATTVPRRIAALAIVLAVLVVTSCGSNHASAKNVMSKEAVLLQSPNPSEPRSTVVSTTSTLAVASTSSTAAATTVPVAPSSTVAPAPTAAPPAESTAAPGPAAAAPVLVPDGQPEQVIPPRAPSGPSIIARTRGGNVPAFARIPADPAVTTPSWNFEPETMFGSPTTFLVTAESGGWLQVVLPIRANNTRGWIPRDTVTIATTNLRAVVSIGARKVTIYDGEAVLAETSAVVGKPSTPTPTGLFYVTDVIDTENPGGVYGPYVLALSARSEVFDFFNGGEPLTALHGTSSPGLIGTAASNGCIRLPNEMSTFLASRLPLGTAVYIQQ